MSMENLHKKGLLITFIGVMVLTPDSLMVLAIDIDPIAMSFWRGIFQAIAIFSGLYLMYREAFLEKIMAIGKSGILVSIFFAISNICFILSLQKTGAANTLIIVATTPMFSAIISYFMLGERISLATFIAMIVSFGGILIVFSGDFGSTSGISGALWDNIYGIIVPIVMAFAFTLIRRKSHIDMIPATATGALIVAIFTLPFITLPDYTYLQWGGLALLGFIILPLSFGLLTVGPRYIPSAEVTLLLLLETTIGPVWVWIGLGQQPTYHEFVGGGVVVTALCLHSLYQLRQGQKRKKQKISPQIV